MTLRLPQRRGAPYTLAEVELIYLVRKSTRAAELLAAELDRTPGAIDFAWRWMDADPERFPAKAFNRLYRLILEVRRLNGGEARGVATCPVGARQWLRQRRVS